MTNNTSDNPNNNPNSPNSSNTSSSDAPMTSNSSGAQRRRRKPRRDGKGHNASHKQSKAAGSTDTLPADNNNAIEDEAALAEGGLKAIGGKRIIPFMKLEKPMGILSVVLVVISLIAIFVNGLNLGLDFTGGVSANVNYEQPVEQTEVTQALTNAGFEDSVVQYLGGTTELLVRLPPQSDSVDGLNESLGKALDLPDNDATISSVNIIGSQVGNEIYLSSMFAILTALVMMLLYVGVRFQFKLALGALLALFHDAIVTLGVFAIFQFPFDLTVLAAILALIGYSLNDTIVVYDRIRENFRRVRGARPRQIVDLSLTETLRRTIMTVSTVLVVVLALLFLGGEGIYWFSVAFFIGLIAGTYSSTYIAGSIPLAMGLSRDDFVVKVKPEFEEQEVVSFNDPKAYNSNDESL